MAAEAGSEYFSLICSPNSGPGSGEQIIKLKELLRKSNIPVALGVWRG
jgi:hypothetical protein